MRSPPGRVRVPEMLNGSQGYNSRGTESGVVRSPAGRRDRGRGPSTSQTFPTLCPRRPARCQRRLSPRRLIAATQRGHNRRIRSASRPATGCTSAQSICGKRSKPDLVSSTPHNVWRVPWRQACTRPVGALTPSGPVHSPLAATAALRMTGSTPLEGIHPRHVPPALTMNRIDTGPLGWTLACSYECTNGPWVLLCAPVRGRRGTTVTGVDSEPAHLQFPGEVGLARRGDRPSTVTHKSGVRCRPSGGGGGSHDK